MRRRATRVSPDGLLPCRHGAGLTDRRSDQLWHRPGERLHWVAAQGISTHRLRHTTLTWGRAALRGTASPDTYEMIERLAHGQKCTAILIIALADGNEPLIIDQLEDALRMPPG